MKITEYESAGIAVFDVEGSLMQETVALFRSRIDDALERGYRRVVLDLSKTSYMNSMSIAAIIDVQRRLSALGGEIVLCNVNSLITSLLEITNLTSVIKITADNDSALKIFQEK